MNTPQRSYPNYDLVMAAFVCVLLCSNLIGEVSFSAGALFFPVPHVFGDILTEVHGYGNDWRVGSVGFAALAFAAFMAAVLIWIGRGGNPGFLAELIRTRT